MTYQRIQQYIYQQRVPELVTLVNYLRASNIFLDNVLKLQDNRKSSVEF
jgi:hypothetical protein